MPRTKLNELRLKVDANVMEDLMHRLGRGKASEVIQEAITMLDWATQEVAEGKDILSVDRDKNEVHRLAMPSLTHARSPRPS